MCIVRMFGNLPYLVVVQVGSIQQNVCPEKQISPQYKCRVELKGPLITFYILFDHLGHFRNGFGFLRTAGFINRDDDIIVHSL